MSIRRGLVRPSAVAVPGAGALLAAGLLGVPPGALAATVTPAAQAAARAHVASWHTVFSRPNGAVPANAVQTVVATGKTTGWAFLATGAAYQRAGRSTWRTGPRPAGGGVVNVATATSQDDVWAADLTARGTLLDYWNGRRWTAVKDFPGRLTALSVLGPRDVWAFGGLGNPAAPDPPGVFHYEGGRWTQVSAMLRGGSALSDRNVWAYTGTTIEHYDGRRWTGTGVGSLFPAPAAGESSGSRLTGIVAAGPDEVDASGAGPSGPRAANGVILHYDGRSWTRAASGPFASAGHQPLTPDGKAGLWLPAASAAGVPLLFRCSAGRVTVVTLPSPTGWPPASYSVSRVPGTFEVLSGGAADNPGDPAVNRSVIFQFSDAK